MASLFALDSSNVTGILNKNRKIKTAGKKCICSFRVGFPAEWLLGAKLLSFLCITLNLTKKFVVTDQI